MIFHSYVSLPEGIWTKRGCFLKSGTPNFRQVAFGNGWLRLVNRAVKKPIKYPLKLHNFSTVQNRMMQKILSEFLGSERFQPTPFPSNQNFRPKCPRADLQISERWYRTDHISVVRSSLRHSCLKNGLPDCQMPALWMFTMCAVSELWMVIPPQYAMSQYES